MRGSAPRLLALVIVTLPRSGGLMRDLVIVTVPRIDVPDAAARAP
jgi:hypothetical protein